MNTDTHGGMRHAQKVVRTQTVLHAMGSEDPDPPMQQASTLSHDERHMMMKHDPSPLRLWGICSVAHTQMCWHSTDTDLRLLVLRTCTGMQTRENLHLMLAHLHPWNSLKGVPIGIFSGGEMGGLYVDVRMLEHAQALGPGRLFFLP